jgi:carbonic anhydrase/acetyltransferase-like protein (isoleucine patch superfamily)
MSEEEIVSSAAGINVDKVDSGREFFTVRPAMELAEGILPLVGGEEDRLITIGSCCLIGGHIFARKVKILDCDKRSLSTRAGNLLPGTQIDGGINAFLDIDIGSGVVIRGGVLSGANVAIGNAVSNSSDVPSRIIIQGSVCGADVEIGDGVVVLGPVIAQNSLKIGNGVTIRDYAVAPEIEIGDGCVLGGLIATKKIQMGSLNTVAASRIVLPEANSDWDIRGDIRSPYPGCNSCPHAAQLGGSDSGVDFGRRLSCHLFKTLNSNRNGGISATSGKCNAWSTFPINEIDTHWIHTDHEAIGGQAIPLRVVSNLGKDSLNLDADGMATAIWEMTCEAIDMGG